MRLRVLGFTTVVLVLAQASYGATVTAVGTASTCSNSPSTPSGGPSQFTCNLLPDAGSYTFDLTPVITANGATLFDNAVTAGYYIMTAGNPGGMTDDAGANGLYNPANWVAVLDFPLDAPVCLVLCSDALTVYWNPASFPSAATVHALDDPILNFYNAPPYNAGINDYYFFFGQTGALTVYNPDTDSNNHIYNLGTPEPGSMLLLASGLAFLGGMAWKKRRAA